MKIVIVGPAYPYRGGIALFNERLAKAFQDNGDQAEIVTFKLQYPGFLFPGKTQFSEATPPENLKITRQINSINPFNWASVGKYINKQNPDLVIVAYWMPFMAPCLGTIAKTIRKKKAAKVIALTHNMIPHEQRMGDDQLSNYFVKQMDGFMALSQSVINDVSKYTDKPKQLTPHPLYDNFGAAISKQEAIKNLNLDETSSYLLFFGIIRKYKGLDVLLQAMADERIKNKNIKVMVAGEFYEDKAPYLQLIKENQLEDQVLIMDHFIPDDEVANYFCAADLIVQPYKHATQSGVTQIAYHFNKPMLVTNVGGLAEMIPHGKVGYVTECTPKSVTNSILDFYDNNRENELIKGVQEEKQKYTWDKMVAAINTLYQAL